ncbi:MAG: hypothetical protein AABY30_06300, partial [Candidatus Thermoplasmatota archaeon]
QERFAQAVVGVVMGRLLASAVEKVISKGRARRGRAGKHAIAGSWELASRGPGFLMRTTSGPRRDDVASRPNE